MTAYPAVCHAAADLPFPVRCDPIEGASEVLVKDRSSFCGRRALSCGVRSGAPGFVVGAGHEIQCAKREALQPASG
ncbi:hypothetical protein [Deinococcus altitudinis]|uniref:hypothetical protein n=1 Tax=Deinococcus altitudinis TaxID=468914 RepID=UPI00389219E5